MFLIDISNTKNGLKLSLLIADKESKCILAQEFVYW